MRNRASNTQHHQNSVMSSDDVLTLPQGDDSKLSLEASATIRALRSQRNMLVALCVVLSTLLLLSLWGSPFMTLCPSVLLSSASSTVNDNGSCEISIGKYRGPVYHSVESGTIGEPRCLLDSKWMRVALHTVKFPGSDAVYDDWMWIDYHDRINVLVEDETHPEADVGEEPRFLVFEQTKYALEGRKSLAIIGGIIEVDEDPVSAARREVEEEMNGLVCENFHFLGRHRTDVNRGMGWLNGYLATKCSRKKKARSNHAISNEVGVADTEKQNLKSITLTELKEAVINGKFIEVQWTATVAQALVQFYS
mmetsp:Transcript_1899/g.4046  ORF Transcript_1899/g.4046 Transcript_1899/m.4046 type:complete len:308 (-) Transcript_1899:50-973(-)